MTGATTPSAPAPAPLRPALKKKKSVTFTDSTKRTSGIWISGSWTSAPPPPPRAPRPSPPRRAPPRKPPPPKLLDYARLPAWRRDNAHVLSGYRPASGSHAASLPGLWRLHNESVNVHSHLLALAALAAFAAYWLGWGLRARYPGHDAADAAAFAAFFGGAGACFAASAGYHLFGNVGPREARVWNGVDYAGIVACVWGSFWACLHFGFGEEERDVRRGYEAMISMLAAVCTAVSVVPAFRTPKWRPFRAAMFVAMGSSAVLPVLHAWRLYGRARLEKQMGLNWVVLQGVLYILGAGLYAARIPERYRPGRFDLFGASHQIFHVLVVLAATAHLVGLLKAFDYKYHAALRP